jgi:WD40 repeat protein
MCWDVGTASSGWGAKNAHAGHITALAWQQDQQQEQQQHAADSSTLALSGGQDGYLRVWDGRSGSHVAQQRLHASAQGKGAVGGIVTGAHTLRCLIGLTIPTSIWGARNLTEPALLALLRV